MADARACIDCAGPVSIQSKTGRCRVCALRATASDPEMIARRNEIIRRKFQDPQVQARHVAACREAALRSMADPELRAKRVRAGLDVGVANFRRAQTPEARERARLTRQRTALAWCPPEFWELNRHLKQSKGLRLADRKRIILEQVPGTVEHARVQVSNAAIRDQLKHQRDRMEAY